MFEDINKKVKTFKEIEEALYRREDILLYNDRHMGHCGLDPKDIREEAKDIASDWVRYAKMSRQDGIMPKQKLAVKHVVSLVKGRATKEELDYGRNGEDSQKPETLTFPVYDTAQEYILGLTANGGEKIALYKLKTDIKFIPQLEKIASCAVCPTKCKCGISDKCLSYNPVEYHNGRIALYPNSPTREDYLAFVEYARTVRSAKKQ
jgi:hypothetical protein